jgi:hypothetical protein
MTVQREIALAWLNTLIPLRHLARRVGRAVRPVRPSMSVPLVVCTLEFRDISRIQRV